MSGIGFPNALNFESRQLQIRSQRSWNFLFRRRNCHAQAALVHDSCPE